MERDEGLATIDNIVTQFSTYEDFLDSQITTVDLYYLELEDVRIDRHKGKKNGKRARQRQMEIFKDLSGIHWDKVKQFQFLIPSTPATLLIRGELQEKLAFLVPEDEGLARQLVELGYRGIGEVIKREDFEARKAAIEVTRLAERSQKKTLTSAGKTLKDNFLKALAAREEDNNTGKVSSVIFIRDRNSFGQEISGYIDYAYRLKVEDFEVYFNGIKRLLPKPTDLSFYNWNSHTAMCNSTPNYQVIADNPEGLLFRYKRDRKTLNVDPKVQPGDNSIRIPIQTDLYIQAVIFDHISRRKT